MKRRTGGFLLAASLLFHAGEARAIASSTQLQNDGAQHPNFSGEWELNREETKLQHPNIAQVLAATLVIDHQDSLFSLFRSYVLAGEEDTLSWSLRPGGPETVHRSGSHESYDRLFWASDTLVLVSRIVAPNGVAVDTTRYVLYADGKGLEARERYCAPRYVFYNVWRFSKR